MKIDRILFWGIIVALSFYVVCHLGFTNNTFENFVAGVNEYVETGGCYGNVKYELKPSTHELVKKTGSSSMLNMNASANTCDIAKAAAIAITIIDKAVTLEILFVVIV